jgi:hypothetical protein
MLPDVKTSLEANPFHVLGLPPSATRAEVEREGQKLLGMLEIGLRQAATYDSPLGPRLRDAELVRAALAELRDPSRRLLHELWASLPPAPRSMNATTEPEVDAQGEGAAARVAATSGDPRPTNLGGAWVGAMSAMGWGTSKGGAR